MTEFRSLCRFRRLLPSLAALPALALVLALSGCAGGPDQDKTEALVKSRVQAQAEQQMRTQINEYQAILATLRQTTMCVTTAEKKPEFKRLQAHGSNDGDTPPSPATDQYRPASQGRPGQLLDRCKERIHVEMQHPALHERGSALLGQRDPHAVADLHPVGWFAELEACGQDLSGNQIAVGPSPVDASGRNLHHHRDPVAHIQSR